MMTSSPSAGTVPVSQFAGLFQSPSAAPLVQVTSVSVSVMIRSAVPVPAIPAVPSSMTCPPSGSVSVSGLSSGSSLTAVRLTSRLAEVDAEDRRHYECPPK